MPLKRLDPGARSADLPVRRVTYPGELGAAPTGVSFAVPADWSVAPVRGALAVARAPTPGARGLHANLVISVDRVACDHTLSGIAQDVLRDARARTDGLVVVDERLAEVAGLPALRREQRVEPAPLGAPLVQFVVLLLVAAGGGGVRDCVQITATAERVDRAALLVVFEGLCGSLLLGDAGPR